MPHQTSRRQFFAVTALGAVGTASAQNDDNDGDDEDDNSIVPLAPGAELAAAAAEATQYLFSSVESILPFTGPDVDGQSYQDLEAQETQIEIYKDAKEMGTYDDQVLTNLENLVNFAPNALYADAKFAALEAHKQGESLTEAKTAAEEIINSRVATSQKNLLKHWDFQLAKIDRMRTKVANTDGLKVGEVFTWSNSQDLNDLIIKQDDDDWTLVDGSKYTGRQVSIDYFNDEGNDRNDYLSLGRSSVDTRTVRVRPAQSGEQATVLNAAAYATVWNKLTDLASTTRSEIKTLLDNVYNKLGSAQYDTSNLITGTDLAGLASDQPKSYAAAAADLAALNVPLADPRLVIELPQANDGQGRTYEGTLAISGGADLELTVGKTYTPADLPGQVVMVYNYRDPETDELRGAKTVLEQPFRITDAITDDGQSQSTVTFSGRNQQTTETNVDSLVKELKQLSKTQREIEEQQKQIAASSGGIQLPNVDGVWPAVVIIGGLWVLVSRSEL